MYMNLKNLLTAVPRKIRKKFSRTECRMTMEDRESAEYFKKRRELLQRQKVEILKRYGCS